MAELVYKGSRSLSLLSVRQASEITFEMQFPERSSGKRDGWDNLVQVELRILNLEF
jgi:hypothetical protein